MTRFLWKLRKKKKKKKNNGQSGSQVLRHIYPFELGSGIRVEHTNSTVTIFYDWRVYAIQVTGAKGKCAMDAVQRLVAFHFFFWLVPISLGATSSNCG